jgi:hypothetical protein
MWSLLYRKWDAARYTSTLFIGSRTIEFLPLRTNQELLAGITFQSHDELLAGIVAVLGQIPIETLQLVFEH